MEVIMATNKAGDSRGMANKKMAEKDNEIRELRRAYEEAQRQNRELQRKIPKTPDSFVWGKRFSTYMSDSDKSRLIEENLKTLRTAFLYAQERKRKLKKHQWEAVVAQLKSELNDWVLFQTGDQWELREVTLVEAFGGGKGLKQPIPEDDFMFLTFDHPGFIEAQIGDKRNNIENSVTPSPTTLHVKVRIYRYEIEEF
jgi:hypothetical protein